MNLLTAILRRQAAARHLTAAARVARRRRHMALENLEERKVLSTVAPSSGSFEGMAWTYSENAATRTGTLDFTSTPGSARVQIQAQHLEVYTPSGYAPGPVNGLTWTDNDNQGGVNITPGTHVNITVHADATDDQFVNNDTADFSLATVRRTSGPTGPTGPVTPPASHPGVAQTGTALGLAWRFAPDGSSTGGGTLYIQDVARGRDSADPANQTIWINQDSGHMILDIDESQPAYGPAVASTAKVKVVVAETAGDINVQNDGLSASLFSAEDRLQSGNIQVANNRYLSWTLDENVVTEMATFTLNSGQSDHAAYNINARYQGLSPSDPGFVANNDPVIGLEVSDQQGNSGGPDFIAGVDPTIKGNIRIVTTGGATFRNYSGF